MLTHQDVASRRMARDWRGDDLLCSTVDHASSFDAHLFRAYYAVGLVVGGR